MRWIGFLPHEALLAALAAPLNAQVAVQVATGPGRIAGMVLDTLGKPLRSAAVMLRSAAGSAIVTGVLTDRDGRFRIEGLPLGNNLLRVSLIGYKPRSSEVIRLTTDRSTVDLGRVDLQVSAVALDQVQVQVDRPAAVAIHLNGRPTPMQGEQLANFLRQLPGNRIDRVEVMPNPSAKHDPEGMGGIVNIVLQKGRLTLFTRAGLNTYRDEAWNRDLRQNPITGREHAARAL